jgi:hypothetical protein
MDYHSWSDAELIEELRALDSGETVNLDTKDSDFVNGIFERYEDTEKTLSIPQRKWIIDIIERNQGKY